MARRRTDSWRHQGDFRSGVLSRTYWGEKSDPVYQTGVLAADNMDVTPEGNLARRPGTVETGIEHRGHYRSRLINWQVIETQAALAWFTDDGTVTVVGADSIPASIEQLENPSFTAGLEGWQHERAFASIYDFDLIYLQPLVDEAAYVEQTAAAEDLVSATLTIDMASYLYYWPTIEVTIEAWHTSQTPGNLIYSREFVLGNNEEIRFTAALDLPTTPFTGDLIVRASMPEKPALNIISAMYFYSISLIGTQAGGTPVTFSHPYSGGQLQYLQYVQNPYEGQLVITHEAHDPHELVWTGSAWEFGPITFDPDPPPWGGGQRPAVCGSVQGRLVLACTVERPQTFWASAPGDWRNMDTGTGQPDDALEVTLAYAGAIRWVLGHKELVIGTVDAEYRVSAAGTVLTASDLYVEQQSSYGSAYKMPVTLAHMVAFNQQSGKSVRTFDLQRDNEGWVSNNLSNRVAHLFPQGIFDMAISRGATPVLWVVFNSRRVLRLTFDPATGVIGWTRWMFADFHPKSVAVQQVAGEDVVYLSGSVPEDTGNAYQQGIVAVTGSGATQLNLNKQYFVDQAQEQLSSTPTTAISGLVGFRDGSEVEVFTDGVYAGRVEVTGGACTSPIEGLQHVVGAPNEARVTTLPVVGSERGGRGRGSSKAYSRVGMELYESLPPLVSGYRTSRVRFPIQPTAEARRADPVDEDPQLQTTPADPNQLALSGLFETEIGGVNVDGSLEITQDWPVNLHVVSVYQKIDEEDL